MIILIVSYGSASYKGRHKKVQRDRLSLAIGCLYQVWYGTPEKYKPFLSLPLTGQSVAGTSGKISLLLHRFSYTTVRY
jgi:hypothetical protein